MTEKARTINIFLQVRSSKSQTRPTWKLNRPGARVLIEAAGAGEDHETNLGIAEDSELLGFLEDPVPPLREGHLPARRVVNPADHNLPPPHLSVD
jgi:hypothetical protein